MLGRRSTEIDIFPDPAATAHAVAESFAHRSTAAIRERGRFAVALSGGGTPREAYRLLAEEPFASRISWNNVHLFWGDERCVPPAHPRSNFKMASDAFISRVPIPAENIHRVRGELGRDRAAAEYEGELREFFGNEVPRLDLIHLGVGADGHTASLFPFDLPVLLERERPVCPVLHRPSGEPRVTLTAGVLNAARCTEFLVVGRAKSDIARTVIRGPLDPLRVPAQLIRPSSGKLCYLLDEQAAAALIPDSALGPRAG